jgi:hypothetical protein
MQGIALAGAWAGAITLAGIWAYHGTLMVTAGQRVSGTGDLTLITSYYSQPIVGTVGLFGAVFLPALIVFAVALREVVGRSERSRFLANVGLVAAIVELGLLMTMLAAQAALVESVRVGENPQALFRFWDVLYNSLTYAPEATLVAAFGFAMHGASRFPRWIRGLSLVTAALLAINVSAIWIGIPDPLTLPSALLLSAWFAAASFGLARTARVPASALASQPASA